MPSILTVKDVANIVVASADTFGPPIVEKSGKLWSISLYRKSPSGMHVCLNMHLDSCQQTSYSLAIDYVVHFFEECPNPSGVFGVDKEITGLLSSELMGQVLFRHGGGLSWLRFDESSWEMSFGRFWSEVSPETEQEADEIAAELATDEFRRKAHDYFVNLKNLPESKEEIVQALEPFGSPKILDSCPGLRYSVAKAAGQLWWKSKGNKHWTEV